VRNLRRPIGTMLLACGMGLAIPAPALADHGPDNEIYEETRSHAGRNSAWSERVTSCVDADGDVYHRNVERRADRGGETTRDSRSGDSSACHRDTAGNKPLVSTGDITVAPGEIVVLNPPTRTGQREMR
jgi:hypothetical protein